MDDMTDEARRLLREALGAAADALTADFERGQLLWSVGEARAYGRRDGEDAVLVTTLGSRGDHEYRWAGVELAWVS